MFGTSIGNFPTSVRQRYRRRDHSLGVAFARPESLRRKIVVCLSVLTVDDASMLYKTEVSMTVDYGGQFEIESEAVGAVFICSRFSERGLSKKNWSILSSM